MLRVEAFCLTVGFTALTRDQRVPSWGAVLDSYTVGPLHEAAFGRAFEEARLAFWRQHAEFIGLSQEEAAASSTGFMERGVEAAPPRDVIMWVGSSHIDQFALLRTLSLLYELELDVRFKVVQPDDEELPARYNSLDADRLLSYLDAAAAVPESVIRFGHQLWRFLCQADPFEWWMLAGQKHPWPLAGLGDALRVALRDLPEESTGLTWHERLVLERLRQAPSPYPELAAALISAQPRTDLWVPEPLYILGRLTRSKSSVVRPTLSPTVPPTKWPVLELTHAGRSVLKGASQLSRYSPLWACGSDVSMQDHLWARSADGRPKRL